jgi:hypothetical protein
MGGQSGLPYAGDEYEASHRSAEMVVHMRAGRKTALVRRQSIGRAIAATIASIGLLILHADQAGIHDFMERRPSLVWST